MLHFAAREDRKELVGFLIFVTPQTTSLVSSMSKLAL
jgi:hypothetical protein